jgi:hypothetical protein
MNFAQVAPICVVAFAVWCALSGRLQPAARRGVILILVTMALHVALVCVLSDQPVREGVPDADLRYVAPLIPLGAILAAILCAEAWRRSRLVGGLAAAVALLTGAFSLNLGCGFLGEYVTETFHLRPVPPTSTEVAVQYLAGRARQDSLALVTPVYRRDPLMFYLGDRLRFCGILPADDRRIVPRARELGLPEYVYSGQVDPDWVVWFRMERRGLRQDILDNIRPLAHKPPVALRVWWDDLSRPELTRHQAFPPQITDANIQQAVWVVERDRGR